MSREGRPRRPVSRPRAASSAAPVGSAGVADAAGSAWQALRETLGVAAVSEYDRVMGAACEQLERLGYAGPRPVSWRWGTLVVEAGSVDAVRLRLDASRLCAAIAAALPDLGQGGGQTPVVSRLEVRVSS